MKPKDGVRIIRSDTIDVQDKRSGVLLMRVEFFEHWNALKPGQKLRLMKAIAECGGVPPAGETREAK